MNLLTLDEYIINGQELASGNINYRVIPTYLPVNTTFTGNYRVIPTALSKTSFSRKYANPESTTRGNRGLDRIHLSNYVISSDSQ